VRLRRAGLQGIRLSSTSAADFISESMKADWLASHDALLTFWKSGKDALECFPPRRRPAVVVSLCGLARHVAVGSAAI